MMLVLCVVLALLALWLFLEPDRLDAEPDPGEPDDVEEPDADPPEDALDGPAFRALNAALPETGEPALTPEDEEFVGRIRAGATMRKIWEESEKPTPAPACARCGGSGIGYDDGGGMEQTSVTIPCPACGGKP